jgi:hypothetical protein
VGAASADRVVFLADGRVVDEMRSPTPETVLDRIKALEGDDGQGGQGGNGRSG